jgi:vacuolar iron transporter family protein
MKQWLRAAILGSNDGLVSNSSLLVGVLASHKGNLTIIGLAGLVAGSMSMAVGEYISVRAGSTKAIAAQTGISSALSFAAGAAIPMLGLIGPSKMAGIVIWTLLGLVISGFVSAHEINKGKAAHIKRVIVGGIVGMAITAGIGSLVKGL